MIVAALVAVAAAAVTTQSKPTPTAQRLRDDSNNDDDSISRGNDINEEISVLHEIGVSGTRVAEFLVPHDRTSNVL